MDRKLRYLSTSFGSNRDGLTRELLRAALRDAFAVIPSGTIPPELIPDIHDAGLDPEEHRWFDLDGSAEDELPGPEPEEGIPEAPRRSREEGGWAAGAVPARRPVPDVTTDQGE